jgi:hypothetical protein
MAAAVIVNTASSTPTTPPVTPNPPQVQLKPFITLFDITPNVIRKHLGEKATLRWDVNGATNVYISGGIGNVPNSGSRIVTPAGTTNYVITATNANGTVTKAQTLIIKP